MKLVKIQKKHYKDFKRMDRDLFDYHKDELKMKELKKYTNYTDTELDEMPKSINIKMVVLNNKVVGFIKYRQNNEKDYSLSEMWVDEEYRGRGVASFMMTKMLDNLDTKVETKITLRVHKDNPAMKLYTKLGFKEITKNTIGDTVMMQKYIGG